MLETIRAAGGVRRIHFVEPGATDFHTFSRFRLPRIGCVLLATILKEAGYETRFYCEDMRSLRLGEIADADLVGISTLTSTAPRAYAIADELRAGGVRVFMGGPHVTFMPDEALEHCDWVFRGEADEWITQVVAAIDGRYDPAAIRGLSWRDSGREIHHNDRAEFVRNLEAIPSPDFSLLRGGFSTGFRRMILPVLTSRGCPYNCSFCSVTPMFGHCYRFRSPDSIIRELVDRKVGGSHVFFYDDHFCASPKRTKTLLDEMIKADLNFRWSAQVRADIARDGDMVDQMARAGCETVYIGMESINPATLEEYNKGYTVENLVKAIKVFHRSRIKMHGMFVLGSDTDTLETIRETVRFAKRNRVTTAQFLVLTPLPGTRYYDTLRDQGRIVFDDWSLYDVQHVVFQPKQMSGYDLQLEMHKATLDFYSRSQIVKQLLGFELTDSVITAYGRSHAKRWLRGNARFLERLKALGPRGAPLVAVR